MEFGTQYLIESFSVLYPYWPTGAGMSRLSSATLREEGDEKTRRTPTITGLWTVSELTVEQIRKV